MANNDKFLKCMKVVFANESGYVNDPDDRGGETNLGITAATLKEANKRGITKITDVKKLTRATSEDIYLKMYWNTSKCDEYPYPLDLMVFDAAVNSGPSQAIQFLQKAINTLVDYNVLIVDGLYGKQSRSYMQKYTNNPTNTKILCNIYLDVRVDFYGDIVKKRPINKKYLNGWLNRVKYLRSIVSNTKNEEVK